MSKGIVEVANKREKELADRLKLAHQQIRLSLNQIARVTERMDNDFEEHGEYDRKDEDILLAASTYMAGLRSGRVAVVHDAQRTFGNRYPEIMQAVREDKLFLTEREAAAIRAKHGN